MTTRFNTRCLDLLQALAAGRKTGTVSTATSQGTAEIRMAEGEVLDAVYRRAEGEKALFRVLALDDASSSFLEGGDAGLRRIKTPTFELLGRALETVSNIEHLRDALAIEKDCPLLAADAGEQGQRAAPARPLSAFARSVLSMLRSPLVLDDLLDSLPGSDADALSALLELREAGRLRTLSSPSLRVPLGSSEQLARLQAAVTRVTAATGGLRPRVVVAGTTHRLAVLAHSLLCLDGSLPPAEGVPSVPMPHPVARIAIDPVTSVEVVVCPLVPAYAPMWPMALAGSLAIVRLDDASAELFDTACASVDRRVLDADMLVGPHDEGSPVEAAMLLRAALEG